MSSSRKENNSLSPLQVANYFIQQASESGGITHLKLQKLVYCAQGWWLAYAKDGKVEGTLLNELPQAWSYGPVYDTLYRALKICKTHYVPVHPEPFQQDTVALPPRTQSFLAWVYARYQGVSGIGMSDLTHKEGTPWHQITDGGTAVGHAQEISEELMLNEFTALLKEVRGA